MNCFISFDDTHFAMRGTALSTTLSPSSLYVSYAFCASVSSSTSHSGVVAHTRSDSFNSLFGADDALFTIPGISNSSIFAVLNCELSLACFDST